MRGSNSLVSNCGLPQKEAMAPGLGRRQLSYKQPPGGQSIFWYKVCVLLKTPSLERLIFYTKSRIIAKSSPFGAISQLRQKPVLPKLPHRRQALAGLFLRDGLFWECRLLWWPPKVSVWQRHPECCFPAVRFGMSSRKRSVWVRISGMSRRNPVRARSLTKPFCRILCFDCPALLPRSEEEKHGLSSRVQNLFSGTHKSQAVLLVAEC